MILAKPTASKSEKRLKRLFRLSHTYEQFENNIMRLPKYYFADTVRLNSKREIRVLYRVMGGELWTS